MVEREWNVDDDIQPLNTTDNDTLDNHSHHDDDDEQEDAYITAYQQLLLTQHQLLQVMLAGATFLSECLVSPLLSFRRWNFNQSKRTCSRPFSKPRVKKPRR